VGENLRVDARRGVQTKSAAKRRICLWVVGSALGVAVLVLPDTGPRVFSFSESHGPSAVDAVGMSILVAAWLPIAALIWTSRNRLGDRGRLLGIAAAVGVGLLVATIAWDLGHAWVAAIAILVGAQVIALRAVLAPSTTGAE
jgi:hypothetical protein